MIRIIPSTEKLMKLCLRTFWDRINHFHFFSNRFFCTLILFILYLNCHSYNTESKFVMSWDFHEKLWCGTQNQKLQCSPETFRLSFYGIQGVPKKFELLTYPPSKDPGGKFCFQLQISKIWAPIELKFFLGHPGYHKSLTWKFQDCTTTFDSVS